MNVVALPGTEWQEPTPLHEDITPPPFPTDALPRWLAHFVRAQATASQVPEDLSGMLALSALSAAVQGRINAVANNHTWVEPITLYTATAMNPGERKSSIFDHMTRPLIDWELDVQELEWPLVSDSQQEKVEIEKSIEAADNKIQKLGSAFRDLQRNELAAPDTVRAAEADLAACREDAVNARLRLHHHDTLYKMRLIYNDLTPEAATTALSQQRGERIAILSDEGGVFEVLTGSRYSDRLNLDVFLKGHSGNLIQVDRIGRDAETIRRPMISLGLAVQPQVLRDIGKSKQMHGRGLLARFMYCVPSTLLGTREIDSTVVPPAIRDAYTTHLREVAAACYAQKEIALLDMDDEANSVFMGYQQGLEPRLMPDVGDLDPIVEWAAKLAGGILRIATLIAVARAHGIPDLITYDDMVAAIEFADYLEAHAWRAFGMMGIIPNEQFESKLVKRAARERWTEFTTRDVMRTMHADRIYNKEEFEETLEGLAKMGYLRKIIDSTKPFRYHWLVNPLIHEEAPA